MLLSFDWTLQKARDAKNTVCGVGSERYWEQELEHNYRRICHWDIQRLFLRGTRRSEDSPLEKNLSVRLNRIRVVFIEKRVHSVAGSLDDLVIQEGDDALELSLGLN